MPDLTQRSNAPEMMDDLTITDERLTKSLEQLQTVNRFLGGFSAVFEALLPYMQLNQERPVRILDVGCGIGDIPAFLLQETGIRRWDVEFTLIDLNPATVSYAKAHLASALDTSVRDRVTLAVADASRLPFPPGAFDIVMASMFLHHFAGKQATQIVREMGRVARDGVIINDLHRDELAYFGIKALTHILPATEMVRNDAPLSVARGFTRPELYRIGRKAGLSNVRLRWRWAFRWVLISGKL